MIDFVNMDISVIDPMLFLNMEISVDDPYV